MNKSRQRSVARRRSRSAIDIDSVAVEARPSEVGAVSREERWLVEFSEVIIQ